MPVHSVLTRGRIVYLIVHLLYHQFKTENVVNIDTKVHV